MFRRQGQRHGLRDVRALHLDPITHDKHGIEGADTAPSKLADLEGGQLRAAGNSLAWPAHRSSLLSWGLSTVYSYTLSLRLRARLVAR